MKFIIDNWALILMAVTSGGLLLWQNMQKNPSGAVGTTEAVRLINREKGVLIDVSEPAEFAAAHARGAKNVPLAVLDGSRDLPGNKTLPLLVMCPTGSRAGRAVAALKKAGHEQAVAVNGGVAAWREAGLPIDKAG